MAAALRFALRPERFAGLRLVGLREFHERDKVHGGGGQHLLRLPCLFGSGQSQR